MTWYENIGAAVYRRSTGQVVNPGQVFEATPREVARITRRSRYQKRLRVVEAPPGLDVPAGAAVATVPGEPSWPSAWTLQMAPPLYLKVHPTGPNAPLAQRLVDAMNEDPEEEEQ